jgi:putative membrane protein
MMGFFSGGIGSIGFILCFVLLTIVAILLFWPVKQAVSPNVDNKTGGNSLEILKERYAKGELTKEQFENIKNDLV